MLRFLFISFTFFTVLAKADVDAKVISWPLREALVPMGFDTNDRVQAVVSGVLGNTCLKVGAYEVKTKETPNTLFIDQKVLQLPGVVCLPIMVPFTSVVELGMLKKEGDYTLADAATGKILGVVPVKKATAVSIDDFLYAPVNEARISKTSEDKAELILTGTYTDSCLKMKEIKVDPQGKVVVVQPVLEHVEKTCAPGEYRFNEKITLDSSVKPPFLLHVRSMSGNAINQLIQYIE